MARRGAPKGPITSPTMTEDLVSRARNASGLAMSTLVHEDPRMVWAVSLDLACDGIPLRPTSTLNLNAPADP